MANSITSKGMFFAKTSDGLLLPRGYSNFTATSEAETEPVQGYPLADVGVLNTFATQVTSTTWTITTTNSYFTNSDIAEMFYNVLPKISEAAYVMPTYKSYVIGADTADTIEIVGLNDTNIGIAIIENNKHTPLSKEDTITEPTHFTVSGTTITFETGTHNGKTAMVLSSQTLPIGTSIIGGANGNVSITSMELHAAYKVGDQVRVQYWPQVAPAGGVQAPIGSTDEVEKEYTASLPPGWTYPFIDYPITIG